MNKVSTKLALIYLSVGQRQFSDSLFSVLSELALILDPLLVELIEISVVKRRVSKYGMIVVDHSSAVKLVALPFSLICFIAVGIVKNTETLHFVVFPLADILTTLFEGDFSVAVSHSVFLVAFVPQTTLVFLNS